MALTVVCRRLSSVLQVTGASRGGAAASASRWGSCRAGKEPGLQIGFEALQEKVLSLRMMAKRGASLARKCILRKVHIIGLKLLWKTGLDNVNLVKV